MTWGNKTLDIIQVQVPKAIARKFLHPSNKSFVVWMILNGFDLRQPLSIRPDLYVTQFREKKFRPQKDSSPMWNFSLFFSDFVYYRSAKGEKKIDEKELNVIRKQYLKPEFIHVRYLRYRPD